jgi:hypothetical protein
LELSYFLLQVINAGFSRVSFQFLKGRKAFRLGHDQQLVEFRSHGVRQSRSHTMIQILKEAVEGSVDDAAQLFFAREFNPQTLQSSIRAFQQFFLRMHRQRTLIA